MRLDQIIPLSLSLFDWAKFRTTKGAVKLHAVLDYDTGIPSYACLRDGKTHDATIAKQTVFPSESVLIVDRAFAAIAVVYLSECLKINQNLEKLNIS